MVSMILGAVVVLVIGFLAYNYFKTRQTGQNVTPAEVTTESSTDGDVNTAQAAVALPTVHVVTSGQTLWAIAEKYYASGYNWVDIASVNQLQNPDWITVGQKLTVPKVEVRKTLGTGGPAIYPTITGNKIEGDSYTVQKGDSLWDIAVRAYGDGFKWAEITKANELANPNLIHAGNVLKLPR